MSALNASLQTVFEGLKPRISQVIDGREYFQFPNGQIRRQIGHGHSSRERRARRHARRQLEIDFHFVTPADRVPRIRIARIANLANCNLHADHLEEKHRRSIVQILVADVPEEPVRGKSNILLIFDDVLQ